MPPTPAFAVSIQPSMRTSDEPLTARTALQAGEPLTMPSVEVSVEGITSPLPTNRALVLTGAPGVSADGRTEIVARPDASVFAVPQT